MLRFRRYRVFLVVAVLFTLLVIRLRRSGEWPSYTHTSGLDLSQTPKEDGQLPQTQPAAPPTWKEQTKEVTRPLPLSTSSTIASKVVATPPAAVMPVVPVVPETKAKPEDEPVRHIVLPERIPISPTKVYTEEEEEDEIHPVAPPGRQEVPILAAEPTTIHWAKQVEHFPIARESIIPLPTGATKQIPKIQYAFNDETPDAKINRQKRQDKVREEFQRAWNGYKTRAWLHDELSPVTGKFRDPFCGWAATLVDTLDTLWIMGLQEDFEEAAKAVNLIDFTTSPRPDIPVFETTIRYLGGLLAAYDVSGATYKNLLDKAVELAEVLMGIFDTPNRMPDLYYRWKPTFASQPHRASQRSSLAELGSLSMEFTRLAQITKDNRYYDAIARITDALSDWQDRGTMLDGVFPDNVDASGCNRTEVEYQQPHQSGREPAIFPAKQAEEPVGFQPTVVDPVLPVQKKDSKPASGVDTSATKNKLAKRAPLDVPTGNSTVSKAGADSKPRSDSSFSTDVKPPVNSKLLIDSRPAPKPATHPKQTGDSKPADANPPIESKTLVEAKQPANSRPPTDPITGLPLDIPAAQAAIGLGVGSWDCIPQGLEPASPHGHNKFSMGGGQDSTYEYFPKQYILLGGLEDKYRKMYMKSVDAIRKHLLYRPMTKDGRDILFSGSVTTLGNPEVDLQLSADVEHLTCFLGGMIGMSAKIFGIEGDLEIAKKLADGCVWAYESFPLGIMPEGSTIMPCKNSEMCPWNETAYFEFLDPLPPATREKQIEEYFAKKALQEEEEAAELALEAEVAAQEAKKQALNAEALKTATELGHSEGRNDAPEPAHDYDTTDPSKGSDSLKREKPASLQKRQDDTKKYLAKPVTHNIQDDVPSKTIPEKSSMGLSDIELSPEEISLLQKSQQREAELESISKSGRPSNKPPLKAPAPAKLANPWKPASHEEFVQAKIKEQSLPPGFASIKSRKYILRPEAIESVWYMYRITGDSTWQDKGWNMFTSIINATSTVYGHSAIMDVTRDTPYQVDEMESFWLAETLKYFYLLYSPPNIISLDEWVLNTEAHPFKRPS